MLERLFPQQADDTLAVESVFSTWLYTGNSSTQTITNGIDLAGKGGLVWTKARSSGFSNGLVDTVRGALNTLISNSTDGSTPSFNTVTAFTSSGFSVGTSAITNSVGTTYVSWTFREAPNFFDVVTYTGNGVAGREIAHNLGVAPGMVIVKCTNSTANWVVWQNSLSDPSKYLVLNTTAATAADNFGPWGPYGGGYTTNASSFTSTFFRVANDARSNAGGSTYVAYLFAHVPGSGGIIQCGSYTGNGSSTGPVVTLGWEPQWLLIKGTNTTTDWLIVDNMRGLPVGSAANVLNPNNAFSEATWPLIDVAATGFQIKTSDGAINNPGTTYIYMAIRRGPMRTPTLGTSVFSPNRWTSSTGSTITTNFPVDMQISKYMASADSNVVTDRLRGLNTSTTNSNQPILRTNSTAIEDNNGSMNYNYDNVRFLVGDNYTGAGWALNFRRAPGFFDEVCYTGTGGVQNQAHNLGVAPELIIIKNRSASQLWFVNYGFTASTCGEAYLNRTDAATVTAYSLGTVTAAQPTASNVQFQGLTSSQNYVAYLFASCPGVSKVGSYTGNGSSQTINCAFTTGARFVLIKRTDSTGDWWVWDTARGIVSANDPALRLNSTAAETTGIDSVDPDSTGFVVNQDSTTNINVNGATYIFLAIA